MNDIGYRDRHRIDFRNALPEVVEAFIDFVEVLRRQQALPTQLKYEAFTVASMAAGCRHCQAHGAYALHQEGVDTNRIRDLWNFERSSHFTEADRSALRLARDAGTVPNLVTPRHYEDLRLHYTDTQIAELLATIAWSGFMNRYNDTLATVTDQESVDWATENLTPIGWNIGKHAGGIEEQRPMHPFSDPSGRLGVPGRGQRAQ